MGRERERERERVGGRKHVDRELEWETTNARCKLGEQ